MGRKKIRVIGTAAIVFLLLLVFGYPVLKPEAISRHYQWYGSYVCFPGETAAAEADLKPVSQKTASADYRRGGIRLTNVLHYPGLRQIAFGYLYSDDRQEKYDIALPDDGGKPVPGRLVVSGGMKASTGSCRS